MWAGRLLAAVLVVAACGTCSMAQARTIAVLVGIDRYDSRQITDLQAAVRDAKGLAETVTDQGIAEPEDVKLLTSDEGLRSPSRPTKSNIISHLKWAQRVAQADDTFIFFFSGHGISRWGKSHILPVDANTVDPDLAALTSLALDDIQNLLSGVRCRHQIVIMDCCRNDPESAKGAEDNQATASFIRDVKVVGQVGHQRAGAQTSWVLFSCEEGQRAYERPDGTHGVFTYFLIQGLRGQAARAGEITVADLCKYVEERVPHYFAAEPNFARGTAQTPWHATAGTGAAVLARIGPQPATAKPVPLQTIATLRVEGTPKGAQVLVDGEHRGSVPCNLTFDLGAEPTRSVEVLAQMEGYRSGAAQVTLERGREALWSVALQERYPSISSHLGNPGPGYEPGVTPKKLGWGNDGQAYPSKFVVNPKDGAEMVWVPAGEFRMGSAQTEIDGLWKETGWDTNWKQYASDEHPHEVRISHGLWLYKHEVTNGQYGRFLSATGHEAHPFWGHYKEHTRNPVNNVTWDDGVAYSQWATGRLLTEAEWEWCARGPSGSLFPWGDDWDRSRCCCAEYWAKKPLNSTSEWEKWYKGIGASKNDEGGWTLKVSVSITHMKPVGSFPLGRSWCGALDMAGSVWEWCGDWYEDEYYKSSPSTDPPGPARGKYRVVRGGGWASYAAKCRSADRLRPPPSERTNGPDGFRPVVSPFR